MGKKKAVISKSSAIAAKKAKAAQKSEKKEKKKGKSNVKEEEEDEDLEDILDKMRREWEAAHTVTEETVEGPPSRRVNATLTPCPQGNHLWCIGGEFFNEDGKAYFYNDTFRYTPEKDEWRKFTSPTCPGPRSAHAVVATPAGGGKLFLFGGEFSSLHQNSFHHYRDFWCFDIATHTWERIETKMRPSARSGHRMAMWKHYIVLFGGFYDPGIRTNYLNDVWLFDTQEYKWRQIEFKVNERKPSPRSGFSFLPSTDGILLHGGYCKEYAKGKRPVGVMLEDTWFLRFTLNPNPEPKTDPLTIRWEKRKKIGYAPGLRSGCTMTLWVAREMGVLFGGVTDEDKHEETLESVFHNDLFGYQIAGNGRWSSLALKRPKKAGGNKRRKKGGTMPGSSTPSFGSARQRDEEDEEQEFPEEDRGDRDGEEDDIGELETFEKPWMASRSSSVMSQASTVVEHPDLDVEDPDDPNLTLPLQRYNAMLAVLRNTLYIYGGIFERGSREYTLDDFYSLQLDKLDRYTCLRASAINIPTEGQESSSDEDDEDGSDDDESDEFDDESTLYGGDEYVGDGEGEEGTKGKELDVVDEEGEGEDAEEDEKDKEKLRQEANAFLGVSMGAARSPEEIISTPLPGETLAMFYGRSREHWVGKAHSSSGNKGKMLRRDGFALAKERYNEYKPILEEVEKILEEAGLDEDEIKQGAARGGASGSGAGQSRNRR